MGLLNVLKAAGNAQSHDVVRLTLHQRRTIEADVAFLGCAKARNAVEQGGLASPVGANQGVDAASSDVDVEVVQGHQAAKAHGHTLELQQAVHALRPCWMRFHRPQTPLGMYMMASIKMAP